MEDKRSGTGDDESDSELLSRLGQVVFQTVMYHAEAENHQVDQHEQENGQPAPSFVDHPPIEALP